jgi:hypothetical protein
MCDDKLKELILFLKKEGLLKGDLSYSEIMALFYNKTKAEVNIKAPNGYAGFAKGKKN